MAENILHDFENQLPGGLTLQPSSGGVFEISLGSDLIYSKKKNGVFPAEGEVEELLETRLEAAE